MTYQPDKNANRCSPMYDDTCDTFVQRKDEVQPFVNAQIGSPRELDNEIVSWLRRNNEISKLLKGRLAHRSLRSDI